MIAVVLLAAASCIPRKTYISPAYDVTVNDDLGRAIPKLTVRRYLQDYSRGTDFDYSDKAITDSVGRAHFDAVSHWISFATETFGCVKEILQTGAHASCGSYVDVSVDTNNFVEIPNREEVLDGTGHSKSLVIRMTPCPSGDWHACAEAVYTGATYPGNR